MRGSPARGIGHQGPGPETADGTSDLRASHQWTTRPPPATPRWGALTHDLLRTAALPHTADDLPQSRPSQSDHLVVYAPMGGNGRKLTACADCPIVRSQWAVKVLVAPPLEPTPGTWTPNRSTSQRQPTTRHTAGPPGVSFDDGPDQLVGRLSHRAGSSRTVGRSIQ